MNIKTATNKSIQTRIASRKEILERWRVRVLRQKKIALLGIMPIKEQMPSYKCTDGKNARIISKLAKGSVEFDCKNYLKAIGYFEKALEYDEQNFSALYMLMRAYMKLKHYYLAEEACQKLNTAYPKNWLNWAYMAKIKYCQKDYEKSAKICRRLIKTRPDDWQLRFLLSKNYLGLKENAKAGRELKIAHKINKESAGINYYLGIVCLKEGATCKNREKRAELAKKACDCMKNACIAEPKNGAFRYGYGRALSILRRQKKAIEQFELAHMYNSEIDISMHRGIANFYLGKYEQAIEDLQETMQKRGNMPDILYMLGNIYGKKGEYEKAIELAKKAVELEIDNPRSKSWGNGRLDVYLKAHNENCLLAGMPESMLKRQNGELVPIYQSRQNEISPEAAKILNGNKTKPIYNKKMQWNPNGKKQKLQETE